MKIEHTAYNVPDSAAMADWYVENLGMKIMLAGEETPFVRFVADDNGVMFELYTNNDAPIPDYSAMHHLTLHLAFYSEDPEKDKERLLAAGATFVEEIIPGPGTHLLMMRDPWGMSLQFCKRAQKLV